MFLIRKTDAMSSVWILHLGLDFLVRSTMINFCVGVELMGDATLINSTDSNVVGGHSRDSGDNYYLFVSGNRKTKYLITHVQISKVLILSFIYGICRIL